MHQLRLLASFVALETVASTSLSGCTSSSCNDVAIQDQMPFEATLPAGLDPETVTLELCFDATCDTSRLERRTSGLACRDVDGSTKRFPTECTYDPTTRALAFRTNTIYGGSEGTDRLVLTAIAGGQRTELLRGTVTYRDVSERTRGACDASPWAGSFTKD